MLISRKEIPRHFALDEKKECFDAINMACWGRMRFLDPVHQLFHPHFDNQAR